jgi:hypothetical protein
VRSTKSKWWWQWPTEAGGPRCKTLYIPVV